METATMSHDEGEAHRLHVIWVKVAFAAVALLSLASCISPEERAQQRAVQEAARQDGQEDVRYAFQKFAEEGSRNRVYIDADYPGVKQEGASFIRSVGGIPTDSKDYDLILKIDGGWKPQCGRSFSPAFGGPGFGVDLENNGYNYSYVSAMLIKLSGIGNLPALVFTGEAFDCRYVEQQGVLQAQLTRLALENFRTHPCNAETKEIRPYYLRCDDSPTPVAKSTWSRSSAIWFYNPPAASRRFTELLKASARGSRLNRVYVDAPSHLAVTAANFINLIGGIPVFSKSAEFALKLETNTTRRCGPSINPVAIFATLTTSDGNIIASNNMQTCTSLFQDDSERQLAVAVLSAF